MTTDVEMYSESEFVNYAKNVAAILKQHKMLAPAEEEFIRGNLYYS